MMFRIAFIVPYPQMKDIVEETFDRHPLRAEITPIVIVKTFEEIDAKDIQADIVIARGYSVGIVRNLSAPIIDMTITGFDITVALDKCIRRFSPKKIAVIGSLNMVYGVEEIKNVFNCELEAIQVDNPVDMEKAIRGFAVSGDCAVISGKTGDIISRRLGVNSVMIESGKKTIRQAIDESIRTLRILRMERERSDRFESIMDYTFEGIVTTDRSGCVTTINKYARNLLAHEKTQIEGTQISKLLPRIDIRPTLKSGKRTLGELIPIRDRVHTVNCVPAGDSGAVITFTNVTKIQELESDIRKKMHAKGLVAKYSFADILGKERSLEDAVDMAKKFSLVDSNIFIYGETGTGKELFAQSIHRESERRNQPFVAINCAALAEDLLESELFGYVDGAFTGACKGGKIGLFELAHNGTIFLDEIGDISAKLQSRLLRVIQEREIMRIGHDRVIPIDIRILSASNKNLNALVKEGKFREDLLYRLNVLKLTLPALRARRSDIQVLCEHFLEINRNRFRTSLRGFTENALRLVTEYDWPGNVRELSNFCERLAVLCTAESAGENDVRRCLEIAAPSSYPKTKDGWERDAILKALHVSGTKKEAAKALGMDSSTLWRKMKKLNIVEAN